MRAVGSGCDWNGESRELKPGALICVQSTAAARSAEGSEMCF